MKIKPSFTLCCEYEFLFSLASSNMWLEFCFSFLVCVVYVCVQALNNIKNSNITKMARRQGKERGQV